MSWQNWAEQLRQAPEQAVGDLLRGAAEVSPFERVQPYEFLLAILPRDSRHVAGSLLGEPEGVLVEETTGDLPARLDAGLAAWLKTQRQTALPQSRKLSAYAAQVCEALQWPLYFKLPETLAVLKAERALWLQWLAKLTLSAYRDPEFDYWQVLAVQQDNDDLQFFWQSFVVEAGRLRSPRYLHLGLLALARLPLSEQDSLRNLRLQVQAVINRYQRRKSWGAPAQQELAQSLRAVMARNPSLSTDRYRAFLLELLTPLGEDKASSILSLVGFSAPARTATPAKQGYRLEPPGSLNVLNQSVSHIQKSLNPKQAWDAVRPLLAEHEAYLHKSGDGYYFVRTLDRCARAFLNKYPLRDPEIQGRMMQWIHLALQLDADDPRLWMLWELALRQAGQPQRAQWVLWDMTRRFPDHLPCRVELARLLANADDWTQAERLLQQVLQLDPDHLHAYSTLTQVAIRDQDWAAALGYAQRGLQIEPSDQACAVLLATAYARRNQAGDLPTAIEHLQHFVQKYPGNLKAEDYLKKLLHRRQRAGQWIDFEDDAEPAPESRAAVAEHETAWLAFAESIQHWVNAKNTGNGADQALAGDRVLPLPQALRHTVVNGLWDDAMLANCDDSAQREFPLEIRLWRYLQTLQADASAARREQAKQALQDWLEAERQSAEKDENWRIYLAKRWDAVKTEDAAAGADWLKDLLDRYQPLPAPLMA
ncbi:MAG: tetratricopeptide repeat protein [Methylomonas sp.]|nr:tetratricopeptide repeat protein [Methylomonas sp.]